jgi:ubiquinone/menaquinone biosynthesis C-methylase UbiE
MDAGSSSPAAQWIVDDLWAARESQVLITAVELDVFTQIHRGHRTAEEVAAAIAAPVRGVRRLLDALVGIEYLDKDGDRYRLDPLADQFLVRDRPEYVGAMVDEMKLLWHSWASLPEVIRTGRPVSRWDSEETARKMFPQLVCALFPMSIGSARAAAAVLSAERRGRCRRVLDVGAGSAVWSIPFAQADGEVTVTALDYPEVLPITERFTREHGVYDQYRFVAGNLRQTDLGEQAYDVVTIGYVIQTEGEARGRQLVRDAYRALRPGGQLLIAEMIPNDERTGPPAAVVYGLDMVLYTEDGDVFTSAEYQKWLAEAGFTRVETIAIPAPWPLLVATREETPESPGQPS